MAYSEQLTLRRVIQLAQPATWFPIAVLFSVGYWLDGIKLDWLWIIGIVYFSLPFNLLAQGITSGLRQHYRALEFWVIALACNIPFWLIFWAKADPMAALWLCLIILAGVMYDAINRHMRGLPGMDIIVAALLLITPFILGAYTGNTSSLGWAPAMSSLFMWAAAGYMLRDVLLEPVRSTTTVLGLERTLMLCLALYAAAAAVPIIYYGWYAVPVSLLLTMDFVYVVQLLPYRFALQAAVFTRTLRAMTRMHQVWAVLILIYLTALYIRL